MSDELKRMQELAGIPASENKESLNEHFVAGGIVGVGAINQIPSREKSDYEMAFEHYIGEGYDDDSYNKLKEDEISENEIEEGEIEEAGFGKMSGDGTEGFGDMLYKGMDEAYEKYGEETVNEILEMYSKSKS